MLVVGAKSCWDSCSCATRGSVMVSLFWLFVSLQPLQPWSVEIGEDFRALARFLLDGHFKCVPGEEEGRFWRRTSILARGLDRWSCPARVRHFRKSEPGGSSKTTQPVLSRRHLNSLSSHHTPNTKETPSCSKDPLPALRPQPSDPDLPFPRPDQQESLPRVLLLFLLQHLFLLLLLSSRDPPPPQTPFFIHQGKVADPPSVLPKRT